MSADNPFGHWKNNDERLEELSDRLHAWYVSGEQLPELFAEALRKMTAALAEYDDPMDAPADMILQAFEDALTDFDNILAACPPEYPNLSEDWTP